MTKRAVISYLRGYSTVDGEVVNTDPFDFRVHENVDVTTTEQIMDQIMKDRKSLPSDTYVAWY